MSGGQGERESVFRHTSSRPPRFFEPKRPSIYWGVYWQYGKWGAAIKMGNKSKYLGSFDTEEAARAYDERAKIEGKSVDGMGKEQGGGPGFVLTGEVVEI